MALPPGCQWQTVWVRSQNPLFIFTPAARRSVSSQTVSHCLLQRSLRSERAGPLAARHDPSNPSQINPTLNSGDAIHPNPTGYGLLARSIDLEKLSD